MPPASKIPLTDQVIDLIRQEVASGAWPLGTQIPTEGSLASELGVSRGTLREAVKVLVHSEMLEIRRAKGTFVRSHGNEENRLRDWLAAPDRDEAVDVCRALELEACRLACRRRTQQDLARLRALLGSRDAWNDSVAADKSFHVAVVKAAHNDLLSRLFDWSTEAGGEETARTCDEEQVSNLHPVLVAAIAARDESAACRVARAYLE